ncbi:MAG: hypothetical protein ACFFFG_10600 [Candidatus Thorarchaeota archaeon]
MFDSIAVIEKQLAYVKKVLPARREHFQKSFENPLFKNEQSAGQVFIHGITPLYKYCLEILDRDNPEFAPNLELNPKFALHLQYLELYERTVSILKAAREKIMDEKLNKKGHFINSQTQMTLREELSLAIMHAVTHIGQALRLQSLYLRNSLDRSEVH